MNITLPDMSLAQSNVYDVSERRSGVNSSVNLMYDSNSDYYRPLIINVQTGELIDPENASEGRCMWREDAQ